jgi:carbohydrate-selective porin OprB
MKHTLKVFALAVLVLPTCAYAQADTNKEPAVVAAKIPSGETGSEADHMTGDWGGLRSRLVSQGIHLRAGYTAEVQANVSGGVRRGGVYSALLELGLD